MRDHIRREEQARLAAADSVTGPSDERLAQNQQEWEEFARQWEAATQQRDSHQEPAQDSTLDLAAGASGVGSALDDWRPDPRFNDWVDCYQPEEGGEVVWFRSQEDPRSNFWPCQLWHHGIQFASAEHAYQYAKALCGGDAEAAFKIFDSRCAAEAKSRARSLVLSEEQWEIWEEYKVRVMKEILTRKFEQCADFRAALNPKNFYIEATSDDFWACGARRRDVKRLDPSDLPGRNMLGRLLTQLARHGKL